jgi:hypothetical protein
MLNPIRNVERSIGAGGPEAAIVPRREGISPLRHRPHNYPVRRTTMVRASPARMQEGGELEEAPPDPADLREPADNLSPHDAGMQQVVVDAMMALRGENPNPEAAIQRFVETFGEDGFRELRQMVLGQQKEPDEEEADDGADEEEENGDEEEPDGDADDQVSAGMQVGGLLHGPGSGQSDEIEAVTPGGRRVLLSDGEYVIDAPTVAALGDGSTRAGARRLDAFRKEVRRQAYGHDKQAKAMSKGGRALLLALNQ